MKTNLIDKFSLSLISILTLTIGFMFLEFCTGAFEKHKSWVYSVDINNRNVIATASENELFLWDKRHCIARLSAHTDAIKSVAFSHNGNFIVSGSIDKSVKVWSVEDKKPIKVLYGHTSGVNKVVFNQFDNYIISAGYDNKLIIWDWKKGKSIKEIAIKHTGFSVSRSDILAYVDTNCNLKLFNITTLSVMASFSNHCGVPQFHPNGKIIAVKSNDGMFDFIDINNGKVIAKLKTNQDNYAFGAFKFTPDGKYLVTAITDGEIEIWDWQQKKLIRTLDAHILSGAEGISFANNNELLSAGGDHSVKTWDLKNGNLKMVIGDGMYQAKLTGLLSVIIVLTLVCGFSGILINAKNKYSSFAIISILSVWSFGVLLLLYFVKSHLTKFATAISWISTVISSVFTLYGAMSSLYTLPIGLFFGFLQIIYDRDKKGTYIPVVLNLIFCGVICFFELKAGLLI